MKKRGVTLFVLIAVILSTVSLAPVTADQPDGTALVQIPWQNQADLSAVEAGGVPVYARLTGQSGAYLLAGATPREIEALQAGGLGVTILDPDLRGASYYLAYVMPGGVRPDWEGYGRLLLDDGGQVLLRTTPQDAERLAGVGVELQAITFDPKPLGLAPVTSSIPTVVDPDPLIQNMIDQVDSATVSQYDRELAGELPVWVDGAWYTITSRYTYSGVPIQKTMNYVGQSMADLGLNVEYHQWGGNTYPNVIGEMPGLINPDEIFIIGAHIDDVQGTPGADDNASGSVATLLAADIATQYQWGCTLRFAFWTGEEQGLLGSQAYAQRSYNMGENIVGYLNLDMIAWNTPDSSPDIDLIYNSSMPPTLQLAQLFADVVDAYNVNLIPELRTSLGGGSDHSSFWQYGYTSILGIEDQGDFNPYYHGPGDTPAHTDLVFFTNFVKASVATFAHMSGCLIPTGLGALDGEVTAASSGDPIADAAVTIEDDAGHVFVTTTDPSGYYTRTLVAGTYTVTAEAYGYLPAMVAGVVVTTDTVTTQDFALQTAPSYVVSGTVTEAGTGIPLFAQVEFEGSPVTVWTDPATGFYQATLAEGAYTMRVTADLHRPEERPIAVDHNQTQNFYLDPLPCILVVDDDGNNPDVLPYFSDALGDLGYDFDVFDVGGGGGDGPDLAGLQGYNMVVWFSGDKYGGSAGPNGTDEGHLAAYLDGGGKLFLSSQDYLYDFGLTSFGSGYLGIGSYDNDTGNAASKYGVSGDPIGDGLGPYTLSYPAGFSDYGDIVNAGAGASVAFRSSAGGGNNLDVDKDGGDWQTVFFGTSWVPVYNYNAANGEELLQRIVDWFGGCESQDGWLEGQVTDALSGDPLAGAEVTVQPSARGQILAITDPNGHYAMTLPADTYDVTASKAGYYSDTAVAVNVQAGMTTTQDFALQPVPAIVVEPQALEATLYPDDVTIQTLWVTNTGESDLTFAVHELSRTLTVSAGPLVQPRAEPVVDPEVVAQVQAEGEVEVIIHLREQADLSPAYAIRDWAERGRFVYDRLREMADRSGGELRAVLEGAGAQPQVLLAANALAATVDAPLLDAVAARPEVARVTPNREGSAIPFVPAEQEASVAAVEWNIAQIRADETWATLGVTGQGVSVGNIGTGVMYDHPALIEQYRGNLGGGTFDHNYNWYDLIDGLPEPYDDHSHSTMTTGVMVGDDGGSNQIGVAPGAQWITVKAISGAGYTTDALLHAAMDWMLAPTDLNGANPDPAKRPNIGLNAWQQSLVTCSPEFQPDIAAWWAAGILPVFALGGDGPACYSLWSPSDLPGAVAVGGTDAADVIAPFSPRGPSYCTEEIKPEVSAPGVNIRSSSNDGAYQIWSGSSLAAPHLAGTAALVLSADPDLGSLEALSTITNTAFCIQDLLCGGTPCPDGGNNIYGWGRIDAFEAVSLTLSGVSYDLPWLSVDPTGATLGPGEGISLSVTFDAAGLEPGAYLGLLDVESDDPVAPHVSVPVSLTVELEPSCDPVDVLTITTEISGCAVAFVADLTGTAPFTYAWDFGAFGSSTVPTPTIDFGASSSYPYTLTAFNCSDVYSDTLSGMVTVECGIACEPVAIVTVTTETLGCAVAFGAELTGTAPYAYAWDFGAFGSSTEPVPTVDFEISGTYAYTLTVSNCGTHTATMTSTVTVACEPPAVYYYLPLVVRQR
jgi:subtilisin family serine protease